ncbi:T9SS type A sorting domain-containing protein [bacterium]|nr:T9SS type A sorting domain-containing protein [bacterium]
MKKWFLFVVLMTVSATVFATEFAPTPMKISSPAVVPYDFTGETLTIPVTITGTPSSTYLIINTQDRAAKISKVQNGYLGWHYVNKIDTCVYASEAIQLDVGKNEITWSGKDNDGKMVPSGEYTYYIWGFDNISAKIPMTKQINATRWGRVFIMTKDQEGNQLNNPILWTGGASRPGGTTLTAHTNKKWVVGGDPYDATLVETCKTMEICDCGHPAFDPADYTMFFKGGLTNNGMKTYWKFKWVPNGDAILQNDWGDNGEFKFSSDAPEKWDYGPGIVSDGGDYLVCTNAETSGITQTSEIVYVDRITGSEVKRLDLTDWFTDLDDAEKGGQTTGGPTEIMFLGSTMIMGYHGTCINMLAESAYEDEYEAVLWVNQNGDYTGDHNFAADSQRPWVCNDYNVGPYKYNITIEKNGFSYFTAYDMGAVSFGLYAPDGTGLGYQALAGETATQKYDNMNISCGSAYDGMLVSNQSAIPASGATDQQKADAVGWFWVGSDSFKGRLTASSVGVEEAPAAFAVAQNSPNPFNPTTTIGFTIPEAGTVSVDVFNVAGQKVATVANEFMSAGSHSVAWDATGFSAGVYFYTVKAGDFSRTMKMTLLK